jgi:transcriptional regulator with XRE-family HTH domain
MEKSAPQKRLAATLRKRREALDFSQESFADSIGMHRAYYSALERGERNLTLQTFARVAAGLKTDIATLAKLANI